MKIKLILSLIYISTIPIYAQIETPIDYSKQHLEKFLNTDDIIDTKLMTTFVKYDLSSLWYSNFYSRFRVGYIGSNYQRIKIHFISIIKNQSNPYQYFTYGKSKVNDNICEFQGTITLMHVRKFKNPEIDTLTMGSLIAAYEFFENPNQPHSGIFKGVLETSWFYSDDLKIKYNDFFLDADGYRNNEYVGIWQSYNGNQIKTCNWGDFRIPYSRDFDKGVGEFSPNRKYFQNGWEDFDHDKFRLGKEEKWW